MLSQVSVSASGKLVFLREEAIVLGVVAGNKSFCALLFYFFAYACFDFPLAQKPTYVFGSEDSI